MKEVTCSERAQEWVHWYAAGGAAFAAVPIPFATSVGLAAAETSMIYWIAEIYGENLSKTQIISIGASLELGSFVFKAVAMELCNLIPIAGSVVKAAVAGGVIESIGAVIIKHFEDKYPGKNYSKNENVETMEKNKKAS
jgi:hypothetical protein